MNADERNPGQQGYGQQSPQQSQGQQASGQQQKQPQQSETMNQGQQDGSMATGQASYGNSGEADLLSQNSSSQGQESDMGESGEQGGDSSLFAGSEHDMGSSGQAGGGTGSTGQSASQQGSGADQSFADQGQGALNEDLMGSDGTTDIEVERSQGRESDIEGNSL
jgi:hypothetical protein